MTTRVITLWRVHVSSLITILSPMHFRIKNEVNFERDKSYLKGLMIEGSFHKFHMN